MGGARIPEGKPRRRRSRRQISEGNLLSAPCSGAVKEKGAIAEDRAAEVGGENKHKHTLQTVAGEWYKDDGVKFMNEHCFFKNYKFFLKKLSQNWILEILYYEKQKMDGAV